MLAFFVLDKGKIKTWVFLENRVYAALSSSRYFIRKDTIILPDKYARTFHGFPS